MRIPGFLWAFARWPLLPGDPPSASPQTRTGSCPTIAPPAVLCAATTDEIAAAVVWLASPEASFVVGHDLVIDGAGTP